MKNKNKKNKGKVFEQNWKLSMPDYAMLVRLNDSPQVFKQSGLTRFTPENICDFICFDTIRQKLHLWELKSTCGKSMSYQTNENDKTNKMIKWHQINSLTKASTYKNVVSGFVLNFRHFEDDEEKHMETTYFMKIDDFNRMIKTINKKSFNIIDIVLYGAIKIDGNKKRTQYRWDVDEFLTHI